MTNSANDKKEEDLQKPVHESEVREKDKLKVMSFPQKAEYIWTYYKAPILITAAILIFVISMAHHLITDNQESILYSMVINGAASQADNSSPQMYQDFLAEKGLSPDDYKVDYHSGLYITLNEEGEARDIQIFSAVATLLMSGTVDHVMTDEDIVVMLAEIGYIMPVNQYLTEEEIASYDKEGKIIYGIDPETKERTAFGISLGESEKINQSGLFVTPPVFAMIYAAPHQDNSVDFLHFLEP